MSAPLFKADVRFYQRLLKCAGLYNSAIDGQWGPKTSAADAAFDKVYNDIKAKYGAVDTRSEGIIQTLLPKAQEMARRFMAVAVNQPFQVKLLSGTRTYAEQNALYAQRPKVTNAKGGQSNHNFGIAWDVGIFVDGLYYTGRNRKEEQAYAQLAAAIKASLPGLEWGGDWKSFPDMPHYQLATDKSLSQVRALFESGTAFA